MSFSPYPGPRPGQGFSSQTWLSRQVNDLLHSGSYYCWFSSRFNAMANGDSSNPISIYSVLDRAVSQGDVNNAKVKDVRTNLMRAAVKELRKASRAAEIRRTLTWIRTAPIQMFTPQLWRVDVAAISGRYTGGHQYPDEYLVTDLKGLEFEVIID